jgi:hypothetical protein
MDSIQWLWNGITGFVYDVFHELAGDALGFGITLALVLVLLIPVYLIMKKMGYLARPDGRKTTFGEDLAELFHPPKLTQEQVEKARKIQAVGDQLRVVTMRRHPHTFRFGLSVDPKKGVNFDFSAGNDAGAHHANLPVAAGWGDLDAMVPASSAAGDIDDSKLSIAHAYLSSGESLETVCGLLNPEFRKWSTFERVSYQAHLRSRLDAMRPVEEGGAGAEQAS